MERDKKILLGLILILSFSLISSEYTTIENRGDCSNPIMGLYSLINAHGEIFSETNYNYVLCANYSGTHTCNGTNKIVGLYSNTNAHAEIPSLENYPVDVCYEGVSCEAKSSCLSGEEEVLSLYADTNSHLGQPGAYGTKICCDFDVGATSTCGPSDGCDEDADCSPSTCDMDSCECVVLPGACEFNTAVWTPLGPVEEGTQVSLTVNGNHCDSKELSFELFENDGIFGNDEVVLDYLPANVFFSGGIATSTWIAEWIDDSDGSDSDPEFIFVASLVEDSSNKIESETELKVNLTEEPICGTETLCKDYLTPTSCEFDACHVGNSSVIEGLCNTTTQCEWNGTGCSKEEEPICDLGGTLGSISIGTCNYEEDTEDDCEDGYLTYNWTGTWAWSLENNFTEAEVNGRTGFIEDLYFTGVWRYNPNSDYEECSEGSNLLACPAHIELSFFNWINVVIIILVIGLVYYFLNKKPSKVNSKKSKKSRTKR